MLIIGVDNGNYNTKSSEGMIYTSGFTASDTPTLSIENQLEFNGKFYAIGTNRMNVQQDKTVDDDVFILTLPAIADAMKKCDVYESEIVLGVGLPISHFGAQRERFANYFTREKIEFKWAGQAYYIDITQCKVFPQGYAVGGVYATAISDFGSLTLIDIGGYTVDVMRFRDGLPEKASHRSLPAGTITLFNNIKNELMKESIFLEDIQITDALFGRIEHLRKTFIDNTINRLCMDYAKNLYNAVREMGIDLELPVALAGGGSEVLKPYLKMPSVNIIGMFNKFANADGYKYLAEKSI